MAFSDKEVSKQIQHMVSFIEQEAAEKANEVLVKAEEEFNIEKGRLVQEEKLKIMEVYEKKEKQADVQKRIIYSNELNKNRLRVLEFKHSQVMALLEEAKARLADIVADTAKYRALMSGLMLEGCFRLMEPEVLLVARQMDGDLVRGLVEEVARAYTDATSREVKLGVAVETLPASCCGGVVAMSVDGRIRCGQELGKRLEAMFEMLVPQIRVMLFGRSKSRKHLD